SKFRGSGFMHSIIEWSRQYGKTNGKEFIRMDTWGDNPKLINYYVKCGFNHIKTVILDEIEGLPIHYKKNETLALLELKV
ncbi:MAG TPA: GNAT family N-acetyltransferase, partial [Puia sp.]